MLPLCLVVSLVRRTTATKAIDLHRAAAVSKAMIPHSKGLTALSKTDAKLHLHILLWMDGLTKKRTRHKTEWSEHRAQRTVIRSVSSGATEELQLLNECFELASCGHGNHGSPLRDQASRINRNPHYIRRSRLRLRFTQWEEAAERAPFPLSNQRRSSAAPETVSTCNSNRIFGREFQGSTLHPSHRTPRAPPVVSVRKFRTLLPHISSAGVFPMHYGTLWCSAITVIC